MNRRAFLAGSSLLLGGWGPPGGSAIPISNPFQLGQFYQGVGPVWPHNSTVGRTTVNPATLSGTTKCVMVIGDSMPANSGPTPYTVTQAKNYNFNISDGGLYKTVDPVLGAAGGFASPHLSSPCAGMGDNLITGGFCTNAVILPNGMGSCLIADWAVGGALNQNIRVMAQRFAATGLTLDAIVWHGGVNDNIAGTSQVVYAAGLTSLIATLRIYWPSVPILIGVCTVGNIAVSAPIQAAQAAAVNHPAGIWAGVNSDAYAAPNFQADGHFSDAGTAKFATDIVALLHTAGAV